MYDLAMLTLAAFLLLLGQPHDFETEARDVAKAVIAGDYAGATRNFNAEMMKGLPPEILKQVYEQQIAPNVGAFESAGDATSEKLGSVTVVTIPAKFEKGPVSIVVAFDAEGKVGGLFFRPGRAPEPAPTRFADYQTKTRLQLPFDDQWFVFWGGRTVQQNYHVIAKDQRFAYDILIMRDGKSHEGDDKVLANYYCFDKPIYAPAAGTITEVADGIDDNVPGVMNRFAPAGNHIVIDHGNNEFSVMAHFRKGSVAVRVGDKVKQGQLVGHCGNSGNTSEPHLHYHLQNTGTFGNSEGLPAPFVNYVADGKRVERGEPVKGQLIMRFRK
ncbi:MAG: M23 family peptidase [Acidobacteria bacterium]|nr:MAG: M23 family peptidase [Acidobacteriota bacterium]